MPADIQLTLRLVENMKIRCHTHVLQKDAVLRFEEKEFYEEQMNTWLTRTWSSRQYQAVLVYARLIAS